MAEDDIKVDSVRTGLKKDAAKVSASMATALLVYSGISLKMLVDQRLDAALHTMFMVEYEPNANAHPHDHPLEEAYYIMYGEVEAWADDEKYLMKPAISCGPASAARTRSTTAATRPCAGSRRSRRSRPRAIPTAGRATGSTSPSNSNSKEPPMTAALPTQPRPSS